MPKIPEIAQKIKGKDLERLLLPTLIVLVGLGAFGLGRLSSLEDSRSPVSINEPEVVAGVGAAVSEEVVASRSGSKYHYPWCSGAARIKESNKITFSSPEEARKAGYTPAANCEGLK